MKKITVPRRTYKKLMKNAENFSREGMRRFQQLSPEKQQQWLEEQKKREDLFNRGVEICLNCGLESNRETAKCEFCGADKLPF